MKNFAKNVLIMIYVMYRIFHDKRGKNEAIVLFI